MDALYQNYFDAFVIEAKKYIKQGIAVKCQFYPFDEGALIYIELSNNEQNKAVQRKTEKIYREHCIVQIYLKMQLMINLKTKI